MWNPEGMCYRISILGEDIDTVPSLARHFYNGDHLDVTALFVTQKLPRDTVLQSEDLQVLVHRDVFSIISPVFWNFCNPETKDPILLDTLEPDALRELVKYAYTGDLEVSETTVQPLLKTALVLEIPFVERSCREHLRYTLTPSNCLGIKLFSGSSATSKLSKLAKRYAELHFLDVINCMEFKHASVMEVMDLISSDNLFVSSEEDVFDAVTQWIGHDIYNRIHFMHSLQRHIRFELIPYDILGIKFAGMLLASARVSAEYLNRAIKYHHLFGVERKTCKDQRFQSRQSPYISKVLYVFGGDAPSWEDENSHSSLEKYDFRRKKWDYLGYLPGRDGAGIIALRNCIWVVGGRRDSSEVSDVDIFDLSTSLWYSGPNLTYARWNLSVAVVDGLLFAVGGAVKDNCLKVMEVYDRVTGDWWEIGSSMCEERSEFGLCVVGRQLFAVGGINTSTAWLYSVESYSLITKQWMLSPRRMKHARRGFGAGVVDGLIYVVGGIRKRNEVFNPATGRWREISGVRRIRIDPAAVGIGGRLYVIGGNDRDNFKDSIDCYCPKDDAWFPHSSHMLSKRSGARVAVIDVMNNSPSMVDAENS